MPYGIFIILLYYGARCCNHSELIMRFHKKLSFKYQHVLMTTANTYTHTHTHTLKIQGTYLYIKPDNNARQRLRSTSTNINNILYMTLYVYKKNESTMIYGHNRRKILRSKSKKYIILIVRSFKI